MFITEMLVMTNYVCCAPIMYCINTWLGQTLGCIDAIQHFQMAGNGSQDWKTPEQISGSTVLKAVGRGTTQTFAFSHGCREAICTLWKMWGAARPLSMSHWQTIFTGLEVLPPSAGLRLLFTLQTEELRGTRRGNAVGRNVTRKPSRGLQAVVCDPLFLQLKRSERFCSGSSFGIFSGASVATRQRNLYSVCTCVQCVVNITSRHNILQQEEKIQAISAKQEPTEFCWLREMKVITRM